MTEKIDLRVVKTHKVIKQAFVDLLYEKPYEQIAVQDILDKALINRSTFYKYYSGKSDLAGEMIKAFKAEHANLLQARLATHQANLKDFFENALPWLEAQRRLLLALWKIKTKRHHLYEDMLQYIAKSYRQLAGSRIANPQNLDYQANLFAMMMLHSVQYYFERNLPFPAWKIFDEWEEIIAVGKS